MKESYVHGCQLCEEHQQARQNLDERNVTLHMEDKRLHRTKCHKAADARGVQCFPNYHAHELQQAQATWNTMGLRRREGFAIGCELNKAKIPVKSFF
jgi:hypothetical protein